MKKKLVSVVLAALLMFSIMPLANVSAATPKLSAKSVYVTAGKTYQLKVKGTKKKAKWSTSKKSVAVVNKKGKVTAKKKGAAYIYAKIGKKKLKCKVNVEAPKLNATKRTMNLASKYTLKLSGTKRKVSFKSSKTFVATVTSKGVITAKRVGSATITAKIKDKSYSCKVSVIDPVGSRTNPADPTKGITVDAFEGKFYFRLKSVVKGDEVINKLKAMNEWDESYNEVPAGTTPVFFTYDVKAISGFDSYPLTGYDIINFMDLYNSSCSSTISDIETQPMDSEHYRSNFEIYNGVNKEMYAVFYAPKGMTSFSNYYFKKNFDKLWVRYKF
ncbi:Ig-like domain-containing protein [Anaerofustis stercorihominis]|uniref:BIG2 domain-containing protein n=1 Tax=Anaerofustis stercorihominis TaxID=214853 RepID=A0A3E3E1Z4_9FIRM|nr:Ig-like domain-containing protein [Anaerofustis stercorihominis]RGD75581.1 hypothetical protein DW687_04455 [Anaerofustis stercorihominis]